MATREEKAQQAVTERLERAYQVWGYMKGSGVCSGDLLLGIYDRLVAEEMVVDIQEGGKGQTYAEYAGEADDD